jgi:formylglycine-generating enzyme required for sulfatase activity
VYLTLMLSGCGQGTADGGGAPVVDKEEHVSEAPVVYSDTVKGVSFNMVRVHGDTFTMGCMAEQGVVCFSIERPAHEVILSDFSIGETEVTQALWRAVMGSNPSGFTGCDQCPVETVSWDDVQQFIRKLNRLTGKSYRLPTEAEWEYAVRGGKKSLGYKYCGSNDLEEVAWYNHNSEEKTHAVKGKKANELGLYDMMGNVWEWCSDWYGDHTSETETNPTGSAEGSSRVIRGGGWGAGFAHYRVTARNASEPDLPNDAIGFRLASQ